VRRGIPKNVKDYTETVINNVRVYLPRTFALPHDPLTIDVRTFWGWTTLHLLGWKLI